MKVQLAILLLICSVMKLSAFVSETSKKSPYPRYILYPDVGSEDYTLYYFDEDFNYSGDNNKVKQNLALIFNKLSARFIEMSPRDKINIKYTGKPKIPAFIKTDRDNLSKPKTWTELLEDTKCQIGYYYFAEKTTLMAWSIKTKDYPSHGVKNFKRVTVFDIFINKAFLEETAFGYDDTNPEDPATDDKNYDVNTILRHELGHITMDHTTKLTSYETNNGGETTWLYPDSRLMYETAVTVDDWGISGHNLAVKPFDIDCENAYKCIYGAVYGNSETSTYDNCDECIRHDEGYDGSGGGSSPINYSLTSFNGHLDWHLESPAVANHISGFNIFVKTEDGYSSINKNFIRCGSKAAYKFTPDNYDENTEYRLEVVYKNGLRDFVKFEK